MSQRPNHQPKRRLRYVYRSAETGRFVSKAFADANPKTTIREARDR